jgi:hypothetical protein
VFGSHWSARIVELEAENERIDSFDGHLDWLHEHYPETTFDGSSGDLGAVNVVLSRKLMQAEAEVARLTIREDEAVKEMELARISKPHLPGSLEYNEGIDRCIAILAERGGE